MRLMRWVFLSASNSDKCQDSLAAVQWPLLAIEVKMRLFLISFSGTPNMAAEVQVDAYQDITKQQTFRKKFTKFLHGC